MDQWLTSHRIGLAAYILLVSRPASARFSPALELLVETLLWGPGQVPASRRAFFLSLPPSVLALLAHVMQDESKVGPAEDEGSLKSVQPEIEAALDELFPRKPEIEAALDELFPRKMVEKPSPFGLAQVWAAQALLGRSAPLRLLRLGRTLFQGRDREWRQIERSGEGVEALGASLQILRDPWTDTQARCRATGEIATLLHATPYWAQIENILYHHQFCWPLLVLDEANAEAPSAPPASAPNALAMSLPVAVDVAFDGLNDVELHGVDGSVGVDEWKTHLRRATRIGKELWRAKHGNHGPFTFRRDVEQASVTWNFSAAQMIAEDLAQRGIGRISLRDGSADAYFTQMVLHRLLGRSSTLMSVVSGLVGPQQRHPENGQLTLNYKLVPPGGIPAKLDYAFACRTFERVVLPEGEESRTAVQDFLRRYRAGDNGARALSGKQDTGNIQAGQTAEVRYAADLHTLADIVQARGWRQSQYIRCPEVLWGIHSERGGRPGLIDAGDARVSNVIDQLSDNPHTTVRCNASPLVIASALWHLNTMREALYRLPPPSLSWAFIRPLDNEQDTRFWQLLWEVVGASPDAFHAFLQHPRRDETTARLAKILNKFEPDMDCPSHRAPDIIVIVGSQRFEDSERETFSPLSRPFMVSAILRELSHPGRLVGPSDRRLRPLVGKTRLILLPTEVSEEDTADVALETLPPHKLSVLRILATFEREFTQDTASLVLRAKGGVEYPGMVVRNHILRPLVDDGLLREGQGRYHIPWPLVQQLRSEADLGTLAHRHYSAGCALAPYTVGKAFPSLALDTALRPAYVHEAERHLTLAFQYAQRAGYQGLQEASRKARQHLTRFTAVPCWGGVDGFLQGHLVKDAYEMATELLQWEHNAGVISHPAQLCTAARAAAQWAKENGEKSNTPERGQQLRQQANAYFEQALRHCTFFPSEEGNNRLRVLTAYAVHLAEQEPERKIKIASLSGEAVKLLRKDTAVNLRSAAAPWFELIADRTSDDTEAARLYGLGREVRAEWAQLWIKGLGAAALAGLSDHVRTIRATLSPAMATELLAKVTAAYQRQHQQPLPHVSLRWKAGLRLFQTFWGSEASVGAALERLLRGDLPNHQAVRTVPGGSWEPGSKTSR